MAGVWSYTSDVAETAHLPCPCTPAPAPWKRLIRQHAAWLGLHWGWAPATIAAVCTSFATSSEPVEMSAMLQRASAMVYSRWCRSSPKAVSCTAAACPVQESALRQVPPPLPSPRSARTRSWRRPNRQCALAGALPWAVGHRCHPLGRPSPPRALQGPAGVQGHWPLLCLQYRCRCAGMRWSCSQSGPWWPAEPHPVSEGPNNSEYAG